MLLRMIFALFLGSAACLNELSSGNAVRSKIDSLSEVASNLSSPLRISVNDLFPKEISRIDKEQFLKELPVPVSNTNIRLNGTKDS